MRWWWRRTATVVEPVGHGSIPDCDTVAPEGQQPIRELLTLSWNDQPTEQLPEVQQPRLAPLLPLGAQWRTRNNRRFGRPDWYNR